MNEFSKLKLDELFDMMRSKLDAINILFEKIYEKVRKYTIDVHARFPKIKTNNLELQFLDLVNNAKSKTKCCRNEEKL
jgi:hypothetical protein